MTKKTDVRKMAVTAMFCAIAFLMTFVFRFKVSFLTFDFKDAIIAVSSFLFGPLYGVCSALVVALLEALSVSDTGVYGFIMNFLSSGTFALVCGLIYKYKRTFSGAILSVIFAALSVTSVMLIANIFITPYYMGAERGEIIALIPTLLLPFNLAKTIINAAATMLIYKPFTTVLKRMGAIKGSSVTAFNFKSVILTAVSILIIVVVSLFIILYLNGVFEIF